MTQQHTQLLALVLLLSVPAVIAAALMLRRVRLLGGAVQTSALGLPDLLMSFFLCGYFALLVVNHTLPDSKPTGGVSPQLTADHIVSNIVFFLGLIVVLVGFLRMRRISTTQFFGLHRWPLWRAALSGALLVAAVYPLMHGFAHAMQVLLQDGAREQDVVKLFRDTATSGDRRGLALMLFMAVIFQPIVEEVVFRGYFYATFKGWAGALASALFTATLFAAIHMNIVAFPALLVLALALTLAYEWSGSLLVPIAMHVTFNGAQLAIFTWVQKLQPS